MLRKKILQIQNAEFLFLMTILIAAIFPIQTSDIFMYLALAEKIWQSAGFPTTDPFIFTASSEALPVVHEWLAYFFYFTVYELAGWAGVILANALAVAALFWLILHWARSQNWQSPVLFLILSMAAFAAAPRFGVRSSWFTDFFTLIIVIFTLQKHEGLGRWRFGLPVLFLFWVNLHPGFPLGLAILALRMLVHFVQRSPGVLIREWLQMFALCLLATFINPSGVHGFIFPFEVALNWIPQFKFYIFEHRPTLSALFLNQWSPWAFVALIIATFGSLLRGCRRRDSLYLWLLFLLFVGFGLQAVRSVALASYGLSAILICTYANRKARDWGWSYVGLSAVFVACIVGSLLFGYSVGGQSRDFGFGIDDNIFPDKAVAYIEENKISGNLFNTIGMGSYLAWRWQGQRKIYIHNFVTDFDFFKNDYVDIVQSPEHLNRIVRKYNLEGFLVTRQFGKTPLDDLLVQDLRWRLVYSDSTSNLYLK